MKNTYVPRFFDTNQIDGVWEYVKAVSTKNWERQAQFLFLGKFLTYVFFYFF